ncbi:helix-turn-helix domain-containing protein [Mucilaginibacter gotjawali]|uniref:AraC-like DNA-binding protein n=2 Tax=Mucilaginibacter gotjawali TaxID=1550579 RepID=A0A839S7Z4_9SPHI|nr:helix-turn-helix domain-containing protein [Mucilaginibacter gotjawali]MBB3053768.1 AraC-like DNA-binding protein [Mucilaginibacter gotjawali]BAU54030.1 transcriptional activator FtrA [Mucilaginibacter gotjawali]
MPVYDYRLPSPVLGEYVRIYQIVGCCFPASMTDLPVKAYWPRAENCLSFTPRDPEKVEYGFNGNLIETPRSRINSQHIIATNRHVGRDFFIFQVVFQPGALFRLTGIPSHELTNTLIDAEAVFSSEIGIVNEQLANTAHYEQMIGIVERFLNYLVARSKKRALPIDKVSRYLLKNPNTASLDWLADQACLSQRQFYRQFLEREGISPKLYGRIARFENAMKIKNAHPERDWFSIAIELGYYDYQHLAKDFKEFTCLNPTAFETATAKGPERTFGIRET